MDIDLYEYLKENGGGLTISGSQICPTIISTIGVGVGYYLDDAIIICLVENSEE